MKILCLFFHWVKPEIQENQGYVHVNLICQHCHKKVGHKFPWVPRRQSV